MNEQEKFLLNMINGGKGSIAIYHYDTPWDKRESYPADLEITRDKNSRKWYLWDLQGGNYVICSDGTMYNLELPEDWECEFPLSSLKIKSTAHCKDVPMLRYALNSEENITRKTDSGTYVTDEEEHWEMEVFRSFVTDILPTDDPARNREFKNAGYLAGNYLFEFEGCSVLYYLGNAEGFSETDEGELVMIELECCGNQYQLLAFYSDEETDGDWELIGVFPRLYREGDERSDFKPLNPLEHWEEPELSPDEMGPEALQCIIWGDNRNYQKMEKNLVCDIDSDKCILDYEYIFKKKDDGTYWKFGYRTYIDDSKVTFVKQVQRKEKTVYYYE